MKLIDNTIKLSDCIVNVMKSLQILVTYEYHNYRNHVVVIGDTRPKKVITGFWKFKSMITVDEKIPIIEVWNFNSIRITKKHWDRYSSNLEKIISQFEEMTGKSITVHQVTKLTVDIDPGLRY